MSGRIQTWTNTSLDKIDLKSYPYLKQHTCEKTLSSILNFYLIKRILDFIHFNFGYFILKIWGLHVYFFLYKFYSKWFICLEILSMINLHINKNNNNIK